MGNDWFKTWFASEDYLDVYSHRNHEDAEKLIELILNNIVIKNNSSILDAASGAGRHSIRFAEKGFEVTGFDLSQTLLDKAIQDAHSLSLDIDFQRADLRSFVTDKKYDLAINLFTSFGYFNSDEENFEFVKNSFQMLNNNGYYVLDYLNKTYLENNLVKFTQKIIGDKEICEYRSISNGRVIKKIKIKTKNGDKEFIESVKLYSFDELVNGFTEIGFKVNNVFGDYLGDTYNSERSERCIIIFQK